MRLTDPLDAEGKRKANPKDVSRWQDRSFLLHIMVKKRLRVEKDFLNKIYKKA